MLLQKDYQFWFCVGSQDLYGEACLLNVAAHAREMVETINSTGMLPFQLVFKPTLLTASGIRETFRQANLTDDCAGVLAWMHTFSPAKSWIAGLQELQKPLLHFLTQFNQQIPFASIDMDFMNENQSAHGDREFAHMLTRLGKERKTMAGHWQDTRALDRIASWMRTAIGVVESRNLRVLRMADNMRNVAVTEGDKVEAQQVFGWQVDAYPSSELAKAVHEVSQQDANTLVEEYYSRYRIQLDGRDPSEFRRLVSAQARMELGIERFLVTHNYHAVVTHFDDLEGLPQLPGLAIQRLEEKGYGFGAEGDWKTAALVRLMKLMSAGTKNPGGTSMLEDYTYHLAPGKEGILQAHMLEICPSLAEGEQVIRCQPLSMGRKEDPARLVFTAKTGPGIAASLIDLGTRFRLIVQEVDCKKTEQDMPKLPVATAFWTPKPDFYTGLEAWAMTGGAHHSAFTFDLTSGQMADWAAYMGVEAVVLDSTTNLKSLRQELAMGQVLHR